MFERTLAEAVLCLEGVERIMARQALLSTSAMKEAVGGGWRRQKNPFRRPLLLLLLLVAVVSWTDAQQLQQRGAAAQGRPGAFSLHPREGGQRVSSSSGGRGESTEGLPSSLSHQPQQQEPDNIRGTFSFDSPNVPQNNKAIVKQSSTQQQKVKNIREPFEKTEEELQEEIFQEQARNAHYSFSSSVDDELSDQSVTREETRDGLNVKGSYSYADGYYKRTVHYEADENGYRVTGQEMKYIGDGPQPNPEGAAHVKSDFGSAHNQYSITSADIESTRMNKKNPIELEEKNMKMGI